MNSLEDNIFNFIKNKKTFTTNDLFHNFQLDSSSQVRIALKVLVDAAPPGRSRATSSIVTIGCDARLDAAIR